jgi:antitoxin ParD1/3/4
MVLDRRTVLESYDWPLAWLLPRQALPLENTAKSMRSKDAPKIDNLCAEGYGYRMATETMNISLPRELKASIDARVRSGLYGNASDVIRAGLRALLREEMGASIQRFEEILAGLPQEPEITPEIEQEIEQRVRRARAKRGKKAQK